MASSLSDEGDIGPVPAPLTTMASAMWFGSIVFATAALAVKSLSVGDASPIQHALTATKSQALDLRNFRSVYTFLHHMSIFGLILLYAYLCEYHPPYPHAPKHYDRDQFFFMTALLFLVSFFTMKQHVPTTTSSSPSQQSTSNKKLVPTDAATVAFEKRASGVQSNRDDTDAHSGKTVEMTNTSAPRNDSSSSSDNNHALTTPVTTPSNLMLRCFQYVTAGPRPVAPINDKTEILNRDQTEEWKGWMQFMFLLYHYYHAEEVYNSIRVMITCYVWMTGFGNFSFFYLKGDYSSIRVMQMLWRLNFLVVFLCLTQGTTYILYYICLLHTYYFLMVYCVMRIGKQVNYTMYGVRIKLSILAILIFLIWDVNTGLFQIIHWPFLGHKPMLGATSGAMYEWYFRSSLDNWSTFLGMVFALNFPTTSLLYRKLEAQPLWKHVAAKAAMGAVFLAATVWWITVPFQHGKFAYNDTNAYFAWIPLYSYIYFRNLTPWLRNHTLELLHQIGKTTLETYLMQHHIWLTSDAKSLLTLIPGWPMLNFLVVSVIYVFLSRRLYQLTLFLRGMMLPNDRNACIKNLIGLVGSIGVSIFVAVVLRLVEQLNLLSVAIFSVVGGFVLYRTVVAFTLTPLHGDDFGGVCVGDLASGIRRFLSPIAGAIAILTIGIVWHHMTLVGARKILPLPYTCQPYVQSGSWIPVDSCNEASRGVAYRNHHISEYGTCSPQSEVYVWGWDVTPSSSYCRFVQRDSKSLLKTLNHRRVVFAGDSIVRHLYHAVCRQLGDSGAGAYNTTMEKWSDFSRQYSNTMVDFRWAPFTDVLVEVATNMTKQHSDSDLVVFGGGAWDRLHRYHNDTERQTLKTEVRDLSKAFTALRDHGVPIVWVTPTTINTWGLMTEEKRNNIREDQMVEVRSMYRDQGVHDSVSFVLEGPSFTSDRVTESYDGVHYPLSVYDAGAQVLSNSYDWLIQGPTRSDPFVERKIGLMANPFLGLMMLCVVAVGIFLFDGFLGVSYLASLVVPSVRPLQMFEEAFGALHSRMGLPPITSPVVSFSPSRQESSNPKEFDTNDDVRRSSLSSAGSLKSKHSEREEDDDFEPLLQSSTSREQGADLTV